MPNFRIDFMGRRNIMFAISIALVVVSLAGLAIRGLNFGIEFRGGTVVTISKTTNVTEAQIRQAFQSQGVAEPEVQSTQGGGYIVRTTESDPQKANAIASAVAKKVNVPATGVDVRTIGPGWGKTVTDRFLLALALSILAILIYISLRFTEWKMAVAAVIALLHDGIITLGIYAWLGREVTPNTLAALLTILGYSLYDTIVVFHRIRENSQYLVKQTFLDMATDSINQVLTRSISTSMTALIPVVSMLLLGGDTLKDFAFALTIGLISGAYSSIGVAAPIYSVWKSAEPKYKALAKKYAAQSS